MFTVDLDVTSSTGFLSRCFPALPPGTVIQGSIVAFDFAGNTAFTSAPQLMLDATPPLSPTLAYPGSSVGYALA